MAPQIIPAIAIGGVVYVATRPATAGAGGPTRYPVQATPATGKVQPSQDGVKETLVNMALERAYSAADGATKRRSADALNKALDLEPKLRGDEDWQSIASIVGGASGAALAEMVPGVGPALAPLAALCGQYLGTSLESLMASELGDAQKWLSEHVNSAADAIGDYVGDLFDRIF